ncbi:MAG: zinc ribbon domain-containing protein, partial [Lachnospiraceae bacterium]|nr:zinc ribbon domain-containing protein [Lachnospiraceae bacterium]
MAAIRICSNCGAKNSTENRFCEDCGYDMNMAPAFEKPAEELFCPNGHKVSDSSFGFCTECGEKLVREKPVNVS